MRDSKTQNVNIQTKVTLLKLHNQPPWFDQSPKHLKATKIPWYNHF